MGIYGAMITAVSGIKAQSYAMQNVSGNIANSQTVGFKRMETNFVDMMPEMPFKQESPRAVTVYGRTTNTIQGDLLKTEVSTNMAVNGQGYFVVQKRTGLVDNKPVFEKEDLYTRRGDFTLDKNGYLINGAGYYLKGTSIDPATGNVSTSAGVVNISQDPVPAKVTQNVTYRANIPSYPETTNADKAVPQSELLVATGFTVNPLPVAAGGTGTVQGADALRFINNSVPGGLITTYNTVGEPVNVQLRWAKTTSTDYASPSNTWHLYYQADPATTGATVAWQAVNQNITFNSGGAITSATNFTIPALTVNGKLVGDVVVDFGSGGLTQYADTNGQVNVSAITQDGYASGSLDTLSVDANGQIIGNYSNGRVVPVGTVAIAQFLADDELKRDDAGAMKATLSSGNPLLALNGSSIIGGMVEGSNTDIADEFSKMIVTQQAYTANTRVISTAQQMLSDIINIVR
jgi:flagellar hook protein FlgE